MSQGDVEARVVADTSGLQAGMVQAAVVTEAQMKKIAQYVKAANDATANMGRISQKAAADTKSAYDSIATGAKKVEGAHAGVNRELLVLAHEMSQGNYTKFGGSMLVLAERTDALSYAMTAAGAATLGLGVAAAAFAAEMVSGAIEADRFNKSLIATNNFAGATADSLRVMASAVALSTGGTVGQARAALDALVSSGKFGQESLFQASQAVVQMERVTGQSAEEIVKDFGRMGEGVAKWAAEHNASLHYLSSSQYEYIKRVEEQQGVEAAEIENLKLLTAQFGKVDANLGLVARGWQFLTQTASEYLAVIKNFGASQSYGDQISVLDEKLARLKARRDNFLLPDTYGDGLATDGAIAAVEERRRTAQRAQAAQEAAAQAQAKLDSNHQAAIDADKYIDSVLKGAKALSERTEALKKWDAAVAARAADDNPMKPEDVAAGRAEINKRFQDPGIAAQENEYRNLTATIRAFNATTDEEIGRMTKLTEGQRFVIQIQEDLTKSGQHLTAAQKEAALADAQRAGAMRDLADASLAFKKSLVDDADQTVKQSMSQFQAQQKAVEAFRRSGQTRVSEIDFKTSQIGKTPDEIAAMQAKKAIDDAANQALQASGGKNFDDVMAEHAKQIDEVTAATKRSKDAQDAYNASFSNGAKAAFDQYVKDAQDAATQGQKVVQDATASMTDAITKWAETGKLDVHSMADSIINDLIRIEVQKGVSALVSAFTGGGGSGGGTGSIVDLFSGSFGGGYYANGLDYVPYDGFPAILHEGERVTSRQDAAVERSGRGGTTIHIDQSGASYGAGVDVAGVSAIARSQAERAKAEIYRSLNTGTRR